MTDIKRAFAWQQPAIEPSHRMNFMGDLNRSNREANSKQLIDLLVQVKNKWPDVEFITSDESNNLMFKAENNA